MNNNFPPIYFKDFRNQIVTIFDNFADFLNIYTPSNYLYSYAIWFKFLFYLWDNDIDPQSLYIICPTYKKKKQKFPDFQFQVTGNFKKNESRINSYEKAIKREVREELGLSYKEDYLLPPVKVLCVSANENAYYNEERYRNNPVGLIFSCFSSINNFKLFREKSKKNHTGDSKMKRISVIIYGTRDEVIGQYTSFEIIRENADEEPHLIGAVLIPLLYLNSMIFTDYKRSLYVKEPSTIVSQFIINDEKTLDNENIIRNLNMHNIQGDNEVCPISNKQENKLIDLTDEYKEMINPIINYEYELYTEIMNNNIMCEVLHIDDF